MRAPRVRINEILTLVDTTQDFPLNTLVVQEGEDNLIISTSDPHRTSITLTPEQAKSIVGRINKFFRDNR